MSVAARVGCDADGCARHFVMGSHELEIANGPRVSTPAGRSCCLVIEAPYIVLPADWTVAGAGREFRILCREHAAEVGT